MLPYCLTVKYLTTVLYTLYIIKKQFDYVDKFIKFYVVCISIIKIKLFIQFYVSEVF